MSKQVKIAHILMSILGTIQLLLIFANFYWLFQFSLQNRWISQKFNSLQPYSIFVKAV